MNRVGGAAAKEKGFIVDYVGIGHHLKKAIDNYDDAGAKRSSRHLKFPGGRTAHLQADYNASDGTAEKAWFNRFNRHDAFFDLFYDEDVRFEFMLAFKKLTRVHKLGLPARQALDYLPDY